MKRREDIYNLGNDYAQVTSAYFVTAETAEDAGVDPKKVYSDGIYHYAVKPVYELSGGEDALNKRILNKLPQSDWTAPEFDGAEAFSAQSDASAVFSPDYATGIVDGTVEGPFKKPCGC